MTLAERLSRLRSARGQSYRDVQRAIASATGQTIAVSYLHRLEREETNPGILVLAAIAAGYDMIVQELIAPVTFAVKEATR